MKRFLSCLSVLVVLLFSFACKENNDGVPIPPDLTSGDESMPTPFEFDASAKEYMRNNFGELPSLSDNALTEEGITLGRFLFYEPMLSRDSSISCSSCHVLSKGFTDGNAISIGIGGALGIRNSMALVNLAWQNHFFWNGSSHGLEDMALKPVEKPTEMDLSIDQMIERLRSSPFYEEKFEAAFPEESISETTASKAISQFMRSIVSINSKYDRYLRGEYDPTDLELLGIDLFFTHPEPSQGVRGGNCGDCHLGALTSGSRSGYEGFHNVGLDGDGNLDPGLFEVTGNQRDYGKFKAPSLRNIALTAPYMHDGRFSTLEEVIEHYDVDVKSSSTLSPLMLGATNIAGANGNETKLGLTEREKEAILAFLHMLTDEDFISNDDYSNPF